MTQARSIRKRLTRRLLAGTLAILVLASVVLGFLIRAALVAEFDRALEMKAHALAILTSREQRRIEVDTDPITAGQTADDPYYFQVVLENGAEIVRSDSLDRAALPVAIPASESALFRNLRLPNGHRGRLIQLAVLPRVDEEAELAPDDLEDHDDLFQIPDGMDEKTVRVVLVIAQDRTHLDGVLWSLCLMLGAVDMLVVASIGFMIHRAIRTGFEPIDALNLQIGKIQPDALSMRLGLPEIPLELRPTVQALNAFLDRLQTAFIRERRFSSDIAHELRTPVAELRTACEVGAKWPADEDAVRGFFLDLRDIAAKMEKTVSNLLELTRCESGTDTLVRERVPLEPVLRRCWNDVSSEAVAKGLRAEIDVAPDLAVITDREKLEIIIRNLTDNAVAYGVPGSVVRLHADTTAAGVALLVANHTDNVTRADLEHVAERFWRKDAARTDSQHLGLGVSIVKALAELLGIGFRLDLDEQIFKASLTFSVSASG